MWNRSRTHILCVINILGQFGLAGLRFVAFIFFLIKLGSCSTEPLCRQANPSEPDASFTWSLWANAAGFGGHIFLAVMCILHFAEMMHIVQQE